MMKQHNPAGDMRQAISEAITRRDFSKLVAGAAGIAGLIPGIAAASRTASGLSMASASAYQEPGRGGTLIVARTGDADSLDPHHTISGYSSQVMTNIYDTLVAMNTNNDIEGVLAGSWEISNDQREYTFHLRPEITFQDGSPLDAEAVKFTFDRLLDPATAAGAAAWVTALDEAVVVDPSTVKLVLSEPYSPLLGLLSTSFFGILPPAAVQELGDDFGQEPVGSGPWKVQEWIPGERITLVPNEQYQNFLSYVQNPGEPLLEQLVFRVIPELDTQLAAYESGEINVFWPSPRELTRLQEDPETQVIVADHGNDVWYIEFSMVPPPEGQPGVQFKPPFDDLRVRQAVAYGVNVDEIVDKVLEGIAFRNYGPMPTGAWAYKPEIEEFGFHFDPDKARSLLDEAGWVDSDGDGVREKDGARLDVLFWAWTEGVNDRIAQVVQNQLGQIGFNVSTELIEVGTLIARLPENICDFNLMAYGGNPEPDVMRLMTTRGWGFGHYQDEQYQTLVTQALETTDRAERTELYLEAAKKALADAALIPLWSSQKFTAIRSTIKNYMLEPKNPDWGVYNDVYVEE